MEDDMRHWVVEATDIMDGDTYRAYDQDRAGAERYARALSAKLSEGLAYVVACDDAERVGHRVYTNGHMDRTEGTYV